METGNPAAYQQSARSTTPRAATTLRAVAQCEHITADHTHTLPHLRIPTYDNSFEHVCPQCYHTRYLALPPHQRPRQTFVNAERYTNAAK